MGKKKVQSDRPEFRAPVVTIMGHVDHGKTTLLDYIRRTNVAGKEYGGITQHVNAYHIFHENRPITFIDTPGHEAFFAMRERGAHITDIIILVVAADDGVMPQTKEVINLWKKTHTNLIVAINKIDTPGADLDKVKRELSQEGVQLESYGGDIPSAEVSAKQGTNISGLLDLINLVAEYNELDGYKDVSGSEFDSEAVVIESYLDKALGPVATAVVKSGGVSRGDYAVGGGIYGRLRALINDEHKTVNYAYESQPVRFVGVPKVLEVGEIVRTYHDEKKAREASKRSINEEKEESQEAFTRNALANMLLSEEEEKEVKKLNVIIVADAKGSLEAIEHALQQIDIPGTELNIVESRTGSVTLNDVTLASARGGIILSFNTKVENNAQKAAETQEILIRDYQVIYELVEEIESALIGLVEATEEEEIVGEADVRQVFQLSNGKFVAGCRISKDKIVKGYQAYILHRGERVHEGKIVSLKHIKDEVKEATMGTECGVLLEPNLEMQEGDTLVCYRVKKLS